MKLPHGSFAIYSHSRRHLWLFNCRALNVRSRPLSLQSTVLDNARDHMLRLDQVTKKKKTTKIYMTTAQPLLFKLPDRSRDASYTSKLTSMYSAQRLSRSTWREMAIRCSRRHGSDHGTRKPCRQTLLRVGAAWLGPSSRDWGSRSAAGLQVDSACPRRLGQPFFDSPAFQLHVIL